MYVMLAFVGPELCRKQNVLTEQNLSLTIDTIGYKVCNLYHNMITTNMMNHHTS